MGVKGIDEHVESFDYTVKGLHGFRSFQLSVLQLGKSPTLFRRLFI